MATQAHKRSHGPARGANGSRPSSRRVRNAPPKRTAGTARRATSSRTRTAKRTATRKGGHGGSGAKPRPASRSRGRRTPQTRTPARALETRASSRLRKPSVRPAGLRPRGPLRSSTPSLMSDLRDDHDRVKDLLARLMRESDADLRSRIFTQLDLELWVHARLEEELVYPHLRDVQEGPVGAIYGEALEEHRAVDQLMEAMRRTEPSTDLFNTQCHLLESEVLHHVTEEERTLFAMLATLGEARLGRMRLEVQARRVQILAGDVGADDAPRTWFGFGRGHRAARLRSRAARAARHETSDREPWEQPPVAP